MLYIDFGAQALENRLAGSDSNGSGNILDYNK